jgi:hypothetical protein
VEPQHAVAGLDLDVDGVPGVVAGDGAGAEPEHPHEEVVGGLQVGVDQDADPALDGALEHGHLLHDPQEVVVGGWPGVQDGLHADQVGAKLRLGGHPPFELGPVGPDGGAGVPGRVVEGLADVAQRKAEAAQQADAVEPLDVVGRVEPVAAGRAPRGRQQPDLVVVVERADREARGLRHLSDLAATVCHGATVRPPVA